MFLVGLFGAAEEQHINYCGVFEHLRDTFDTNRAGKRPQRQRSATRDGKHSSTDPGFLLPPFPFPPRSRLAPASLPLFLLSSYPQRHPVAPVRHECISRGLQNRTGMKETVSKL